MILGFILLKHWSPGLSCLDRCSVLSGNWTCEHSQGLSQVFIFRNLSFSLLFVTVNAAFKSQVVGINSWAATKKRTLKTKSVPLRMIPCTLRAPLGRVGIIFFFSNVRIPCPGMGLFADGKRKINTYLLSFNLFTEGFIKNWCPSPSKYNHFIHPVWLFWSDSPNLQPCQMVCGSREHIDDGLSRSKSCHYYSLLATF